MASLLIKELTNESDYLRWDDFVDQSMEGNIFSKSVWLNSQNQPFNILICLKGDEIVGGLAFFVKRLLNKTAIVNTGNAEFQTILFKNTLEMSEEKATSLKEKTIEAFIDYLKKKYIRIHLNLHPNLTDLRQFSWSGFEVTPRYTYIVQVQKENKVRSNIKREIQKAEKHNSEFVDSLDLRKFYALYEETCKRQKMTKKSLKYFEKLTKNLRKDKNVKIFFTKENDIYTASIYVLIHRSNAYFFAGGISTEFRNHGSNSFLFYHLINYLKEMGIESFDLIGANTKAIVQFKKGFYPDLVSYFKVKKTNLF